MEIRRLTEDDAEAYRSVRLRGLREEPTAFASSYEEESAQPLAALVERIRTSWSAPDSFMLGAFDPERGGQLVGVMGLGREQRRKTRQKALVRAVYVIPEARRRGVARALLTELIERAKRVPDLNYLFLAVESSNEPAKRLYRSLGFERYGVEPCAIKIDGVCYDEDLMALRIRG